MFNTAKQAVISALTDIQTMSGRSSIVGGHTCPMVDLDGFDSINAVEATAIISAKLGCNLEPGVMIHSYSSPPLSVDQIAELIADRLEKG